MIEWRHYIISDPQICRGQLCAKGTRVLLTNILDSLAEGASREEILRSYPSLAPEHIDAAIAYAAVMKECRLEIADVYHDDRKFMMMAVDQAREQFNRYGLDEGGDRPDPKVGCVVVTSDGKVEKGYRGELKPGEHAEFTVTEGKMAQDRLAGATVYTTLEPCTDRKPPKKSCADRLIERRVSRVVIGLMDRDHRGQGYDKLVDANIAVGVFPPDLVAQIQELNRRFLDSRKRATLSRDIVSEESSIEASQAKAPNLFCGVQANFLVEPNSAMFKALTKGRGNTTGELPGPTSLSSLAFQLPSLAKSPLTAQQKFVLYGGFRPIRALDLSPLDYVILGQPFERNVSGKVFSEITRSESFFSSHTVMSCPGQGKSIALAQILLKLCGTPGYLTLWSFDHSIPFVCEPDVSCINKYFDMFSGIDQLPKRLIFVFDDVSKRAPADVQQLHLFQNICRSFAEREKFAISFLFSSDDERISLSTGNIILRLEDDEENRLYQLLTDTPPRVVEKKYASVEDLLEQHPEKRHYKDDVQSFIDFIVVHSIPTQEFKPTWFSNLSDESPLAQHVLSVLSVSQLFDLPLPSHIALTMANVFGTSRVPSEDDFSRISNRISWKEKQANDEWSGFALSSPYYARSLLRRLGMLEREFIKRTISDIISWSLERATDDLQSWVITDCEYVRHIFQRLAKKELYVIPGISDKRSIADDLFIQYGNSIVRFLLHVNDGALHAKWAGTFASLGIYMKSQTFGDNPDGVERVVLKLCNEAISVRRGRVISDGRVFVPLMRALSRMCKKFGDQQDVQRAALAIRKVIHLDTVLDVLAADGDPDFERRANVTQ